MATAARLARRMSSPFLVYRKEKGRGFALQFRSEEQGGRRGCCDRDGPARDWSSCIRLMRFVRQRPAQNLQGLASADIPENVDHRDIRQCPQGDGGIARSAASATGANSLVKDGVTGTLVDPLEPDEYGTAIARYAADPTLREKHGAAGLAFASTRDWDVINAAVMRLYERVIERRQRMDARFGKRWLPSYLLSSARWRARSAGRFGEDVNHFLSIAHLQPSFNAVRSAS